MNEKEFEKMTICFQEMIDGISCIANYEMNVSRIFYFLKMSEYEKFFERLALRHYGFLDEMIKYYIDNYGCMIIVSDECDLDEIIKEYDSIRNIDLTYEDLMDMVCYLVEKEKYFVKRYIRVLDDRVRINDKNSKEAKIKKEILTSLQKLCYELDTYLNELKEKDKNFWISRKRNIEIHNKSNY